MFGLGYYLVWHVWLLSLHPMTWIGFTPTQSLLVVTLAWLVLSGYWALFLGSLLAASGWICQQIKLPAASILLIPLLWLLGVELFQRPVIGVPWAKVAYAQAVLPLLRLLMHSIGSVGVTALVISFNALLGWYLLKRHRTGMAGCFAALLALFVLNTWLPEKGTPLPVAITLIQGNLPIEMVRSPELSMTAADTYLETLKQVAPPTGSLVILPEEGAVASWVGLDNPERQPQVNALQAFATQQRLTILSGMPTYNPTTGDSFNSLAAIPPSTGEIRFYHKRRLVPFGEMVPALPPVLPENWLSLGLKTVGIDFSFPFKPGVSSNMLPAGAHKVGGLVCFELIYSDLTNSYKTDGADLLVNISNLGWFHENPWMSRQFLAIGQTRAAETGLPLVISANTGPSAIISREGTLLYWMPAGQRGTLRSF